MKTSPVWALLFVISGGALLGAESKPAVNFRNLNWEAAAKAAADEHKLILIDFYTTWCEPCKMLDRETWTDPAVGKRVNDQAVPLRVDAEKEGRELAGKYKIAAYPTMLLLKPDGTVVDRLVGFRPPADFTRDFDAAVAGKPSLARAEEAVAPTVGAVTHDQVEARQKLARALVQGGHNEEALREYVWLYDVGMKEVSSFAGVRLSFLTGEMGRLAASYPPAADALRQRRDDAKRRLESEPSDRMAPREFSALNDALGDKKANLAFFDSLPKGDPRRRRLGVSLFDELVTARRYDEALEIQDYAFVSRLLDLELTPRPSKLPKEMQERSRQMMLRRLARHVEVLAGAGDIDHAKDLASRLAAADPSDEMKAVLRRGTERSGHPELVADLNL